MFLKTPLDRGVVVVGGTFKIWGVYCIIGPAKEMGRRGTQKPHPHPRNVQYEYPPGVVSTPAARGGVVGCISVFSYFLLFLEIPLDTAGIPRFLSY